jgi:hypothetical protein
LPALSKNKEEFFMHLTDFIALDPIKRNLNPMSLLNHVTLSDFAGIAWNSLVAGPPLAAGFVTAAAISTIAHRLIQIIQKKREGMSSLLSWSAIAGAFVIGSNTSYMVAARMKLVSFSADKAIRLAILGISIPGLSLGWCGTRALCVLGSLGAIAGARYGDQNRRSSSFPRQ